MRGGVKRAVHVHDLAARVFAQMHGDGFGHGVIAQHLTHGEQIHYIPEFVERPLQPPYRWMRSVRGLDLLGGIVSLFVAARKISDLARRIEAEVIYCNHMLAKPVGAAVGGMTGIPERRIHEFDVILVTRQYGDRNSGCFGPFPVPGIPSTGVASDIL